MSDRSRSHPQVPMAPVCTLPASDRWGRLVSIYSIIRRAKSFHVLRHGVSFRFDNSDDMARLLLDVVLAERNCCQKFSYSMVFGAQHQPIELRIEAAGDLVQPVKDLYLGLTQET